MRVEKLWGYEEILCNTPLYCAKFLHVNPGKKCSVHWHERKDETFYVMSGECRIQTSLICPDSEMTLFTPGQSIRIIPGLPHAFASKTGCILLEISTHHDDADVVRKELSREF